jgi:hypothetical protein
VGRILVYVVVGYVVFAVVMSALVSVPWLLLLLVLLFFAFSRRSGSWTSYARELVGPRAGELQATPDQVGRLRSASQRLAPEFPDDRLENPALVAVLAPYAYEPPEERERVEQEFDSWRERFVAWRRRVEEFGTNASLDELVQEQSALEAYVAELRKRAAAADDLPQRALDEVTRAGELIRGARASLREDAPGLAERLDAAGAKHAEAWAAVGGDAPRPVTALRLAAEAVKVAVAVQAEAARAAGLPDDVRRRLQELAPAIERMRDGLDVVEAEVRGAASTYAVSSWREIGGVGGAARDALERAERLHRAAAEDAASQDPARLERAARALDEVSAALEDAERLRSAIDAHLRKLETAALEARERVVAAEKEVDRAQGSEPDQRVERAADLARQARAGLESERPDWLAIVELADRAAELARGTGAGAEPPSGVLQQPLDEAKARAAEAHETALAWAIVAPAAADLERLMLEEADRLYREAVETGSAAAFSAAEAAAEAFVARVQRRRGLKGGRDDAAPSPLGHALVWDLAVRFSTRA